MRYFKRVGLGVLASLIGVLGVAASAQATTAATAACAITGSASANVNWDANSGAYTFNQLEIACAGDYATNDPAYGLGAGPAVITVNATSSGSFNNVACGTGTAGDPNATGVATPVLDPGGKAKPIFDDADLGYSIVFAAGQGLLLWSQSGAVTPGTLPAPNLGGGSAATQWEPVGGGVVSISPLLPAQGGQFPGPSPGTNGTLCTNGFNVVGVVGAAIAG